MFIGEKIKRKDNSFVKKNITNFLKYNIEFVFFRTFVP